MRRIQQLRDDHGDVGGAGGEVHARLGGERVPAHLAARAAPHVQLRGILVRREQDVVADVEHGRDLESGRGHGLAVQRDPAGVLRLVDEHEPAVAQPVGHPGHDRLPVLGGVLEERLRLPRAGVGLEHDPALLIA